MLVLYRGAIWHWKLHIHVFITFLFKNPCNSFDCSISAGNAKIKSSRKIKKQST